MLGLFNRDNGKENGNSNILIGYILGLCRDNGKENGNYTYYIRVDMGVVEG